MMFFFPCSYVIHMTQAGIPLENFFLSFLVFIIREMSLSIPQQESEYIFKTNKCTVALLLQQYRRTYNVNCFVIAWAKDGILRY